MFDRSWFVFSGVGESTVYATVPGAIVPNLTAGQATDFLVACDEIVWPEYKGDGARWSEHADTGFRHQPFWNLEDQEERDEFVYRQWVAERAEQEKLSGTGRRLACVYGWQEPLDVGLASWRIAGGVSGGLLLENDLWLRDELLLLGLGKVNRFRAILGLGPLPPGVPVLFDGVTLPYVEMRRHLRASFASRNPIPDPLNFSWKWERAVCRNCGFRLTCCG